ncbi:MAG: hypothetical protein SAJ12_13035 [Jaaginema sp. PMC 1079.18]|nr:hypothetical protein [Jaaginema sp. PMC 1080.18]MEC4851931.1 hypothetical protein [Jaaginema sp. PMC 1079.18]MEC4866325.1 hypothetical protein [Jaaginema sp. PMC 1078.18]
MSRVFILTEATTPASLVMALQEAIASVSDAEIKIVNSEGLERLESGTEDIICPLTLSLPPDLSFAGREVYRACADVTGMRSWVESLDYGTGTGEYWLPIVLTAKGPLYGEAIGRETASQDYQQPIHFPDEVRQPLYALAYQVLRRFEAIPSVYFLQFSVRDRGIIFDCLYPFPIESAIASLGVQTPDLLTCHWLCLTQQPILDLVVKPH